MPTQAEKGAMFRKLHEQTFVIANPWDAGTARMLTALGFSALATTSAGLAFALGKADGTNTVSREEALANARDICAATHLPVSADLENCYGDAPQEAAKTIPLAAATGLVGCSIEDFSGDRTRPIYEFAQAVDRVKAAVEAARGLSFTFTLTARAENLIRGVNDMKDTIRRLQAFEAAGADVLYAPGLNTIEQVRAVTSSVGKPVNVVMSSGNTAITLAELTAAGVKRVSVGGALARTALGAFLAGAREIKERGTFTYARAAAPMADLNELFKKGGG